MKPEFLEILSHPLRQEILIFIEQEGETGYKDLKVKFNVATGTLYHHLRILKGLVQQNSFKKYVLTEEGTNALDIIFQDKTPKKNDNIIPISESSYYTDEQISEELKNTKSTVTKQNISSNVTKVPKFTNFYSIKDFFNINEFFERTIPNWFYKANFVGFLFLFVGFEILQPKFVFFHFIPIEITDILYG